MWVWGETIAHFILAGSNCVRVDEKKLYFLSLTGSTGTHWNFRRKTRDVMPFANYPSFFFFFLLLTCLVLGDTVCPARLNSIQHIYAVWWFCVCANGVTKKWNLMFGFFFLFFFDFVWCAHLPSSGLDFLIGFSQSDIKTATKVTDWFRPK